MAVDPPRKAAIAAVDQQKPTAKRPRPLGEKTQGRRSNHVTNERPTVHLPGPGTGESRVIRRKGWLDIMFLGAAFTFRGRWDIVARRSVR